jgi:hypothetical protein
MLRRMHLKKSMMPMIKLQELEEKIRMKKIYSTRSVPNPMMTIYKVQTLKANLKLKNTN